MPRRPRLFVSGGIYHVYCRTHRGEFRFDDRMESDSFIQAVAEVSRTHGLLVLAWCLMSNHYHLVVRTADVKLWRSMARIHGRVGREHNWRHRVFGPSWQGRYRARLIQNGDDLRHLIAYVHLNPVVAEIEKDPSILTPSIRPSRSSGAPATRIFRFSMSFAPERAANRSATARRSDTATVRPGR